MKDDFYIQLAMPAFVAVLMILLAFVFIVFVQTKIRLCDEIGYKLRTTQELSWLECFVL